MKDMSRLRFLPLAVICVGLTAAAALWAQSPSAQPPNDPSVRRWTHLALEHDSASITGDRDLARKINQLGDQGWELVDVETILDAGKTVKTLFFFKKPAK